MKSQGRGNAKWALGLIMPLLSLLLIYPLQDVEAVQHQVGGTPGWSLPSRSNVNYTTWASTQTFSVGDTLYFNYSKAYHNVLQVTEANYDSCDASSPIATWDDGATITELNQTGTFYYICGIPGHCTAGQKVAVVVGATSSANSTAPSSSGATARLPQLSAGVLSALCFLCAPSLISLLLFP